MNSRSINDIICWCLYRSPTYSPDLLQRISRFSWSVLAGSRPSLDEDQFICTFQIFSRWSPAHPNLPSRSSLDYTMGSSYLLQCYNLTFINPNRCTLIFQILSISASSPYYQQTKSRFPPDPQQMSLSNLVELPVLLSRLSPGGFQILSRWSQDPLQDPLQLNLCPGPQQEYSP